MPRPQTPALDDPAFPHGILIDNKPKGYWWGCRCPLCRAAVVDYQRKMKIARMKASGGTAPARRAPVDRDGVTNAGTTANSPAAPTAPPEPLPRPHPAPFATEARTSAQGASRRLQGLVFAGYTPVDLAHHTQISVDNIWWLLIDPPETIRDVTHRIIRDRFLTLREHLPEHPASQEANTTVRAKLLAEREGWAGPYAWDNIDTDQSPAHTGRAGQSLLHPASDKNRDVARTAARTATALAEEREAHHATKQEFDSLRARWQQLTAIVSAGEGQPE